jgi:hypothetical protein
MGDPYGPILTGIGMLDSGKLTPAGKAGYVADVLGLLAMGNANGQCPGCSPGTQLFASLIGGLPPVPGPNIVNVTTLSVEPLFWWKPDPVAALMSKLLIDDTKTPIWNTLFPEGILTTTAQALDLPGNTPLFPFFDASLLLPSLNVFPIPLPDLAVKLNLLPPQLLIKLAGLGIQLKLPSLPSIPTLSLPDFGFPPSLALKAALAIPQLVLGLIALPFKLIIQLLLPPSISLVIKLLTLDISAVFNIALNLLIELLVSLDLLLITPKLLIASLLIYLKDIVSMVCVDLVGQLVGSGGALTKIIGTGTGLIAPPPSGS